MKDRFLLSAFLVTAALSLSACKKDGEGAQGGPGGGMPQAEVTVLKTEPKDIELSDVLPGRVAAFRTAEIRPQVSGIIKQRLFEQGTEVTQGQVLFQIDPAPFEADRKAAEAAVKRAQATLTRASAQAGRYKELVAADAISKQAYDDALATRIILANASTSGSCPSTVRLTATRCPGSAGSAPKAPGAICTFCWDTAVVISPIVRS